MILNHSCITYRPLCMICAYASPHFFTVSLPDRVFLKLSASHTSSSKQVISGGCWPSFARPTSNTIPKDGATWVLESLPLEVSIHNGSRREGDAMLKSNVIRLKGGWVRTRLLLLPAPAEASVGIDARQPRGDLSSGEAPSSPAAKAMQRGRDVLVFACAPVLHGLDDLMVSSSRPHLQSGHRLGVMPLFGIVVCYLAFNSTPLSI